VNMELLILRAMQIGRRLSAKLLQAVLTAEEVQSPAVRIRTGSRTRVYCHTTHRISCIMLLYWCRHTSSHKMIDGVHQFFDFLLPVTGANGLTHTGFHVAAHDRERHLF
jgi:hypothetical protein